MEKRHSARIPVCLETKLISGSKSYTGVIGNLSKGGVYLETVPTKSATPFIPKTRLELKIQIPSKEIINLHCKVVWLHTKKTLPHGLTNCIGMEIINPPSEYKGFLKSLH
jgi:hypothetical protein